jgi:hypothetical protein
MKNKLVIALIAVLFAASNAHAGLIGPGKLNIGGGLDVPYGIGYQLGYSIGVTPLIDLGVEYSSSNLDVNNIALQGGGTGTLKLNGSRIGLSAKFNLPVLPLKLHIGSHSGKANASGAFQFPGSTVNVAQGADITGTYIAVGLNYQIGPVYFEPSIGTQSITASGTAVTTSFPSYAALSLGLVL